ncbi:hypothetical protein D9619_001083 [Psilocybe cf. subviscida]|uniref:Uncharacterized protein n=1 Tax=Psilocybe cf. subviscida TaxID=2480587 RepID=A0A8H5BFH0_9AGAR|nr:hypothetical protein D9619_001083 [Psilocybe cf. subviscida]
MSVSTANGTLTGSGGEPGPVNIVHGTHAELILFLILNVWPSHFGLPVLLLVVLLSRGVKRHATFVNLVAAFILIGLSSSLLLYAGRITGPEPSRMLCLFQASLLYGMPSLASTAAFALVLQMFFTVRAAYDGVEYVESDHIIRLWMMLVGPYIAYFATILATATIGAANPSKVSRNRRFFYCSVDALHLTNTLSVLAALVLFATLVFIAWTSVLLIRRIKLARQHAKRARWTLDLNFPFRIMAFGIYVVMSLRSAPIKEALWYGTGLIMSDYSLSLISVTSPSSPVPDLTIATAATVFVLIFGTQSDIRSVLTFWKSNPNPPRNIEIKVAFSGAEERDLEKSDLDKPLPPSPMH